ncbi:DegT/DnrJ/EryC1/StrS aminotransferase family protein [Candidatus Pelagibacter sp. Uisw_092]|uniref:DegT/DnrJ/EryC1/StrS family aminotransferase n=1 Tax=Candidatus Pelagibacter sp. Uisw_092 TaxID=3230979 RepID=UPI0039EC2D17
MKQKLKLNKVNFFPVSKPTISKQDILAVNKTLKNGWISSNGPEINKFEKEFSKLVSRKYSTTVSNGTAALEVAIKALGITKDDEVLIPNFTIISNALAVLRQQATPVLIDCNLENWNIKIEDIEKKITKKTKAIIITHIYSFPNDMDKILKICKKYNILVIEDAAELIGSNYKNKKCGSFGDISTFSFYANKQITTGEGGMISTNSVSLYEKCNSLKNLCFGSIDRFNHVDIGWNYRMTNMQAALGLSQLKNIKVTVKKKIEIGNRYYKELHKNKNIQILPPSNNYSKNIYWIIGILVKNKKINVKKITNKLLSFGIQTRPFFWPMNEQKIFKKLKIFDNKNNKYPNSQHLSRNGFYLPSYLELKNNEIDYICNIVNKVIR